MSNVDLLKSLDTFKKEVSDFAKKTVSTRTAEDGSPIPEGNPAIVTQEGEESIVGHIHSALERYVEPLLKELKGDNGN